MRITLAEIASATGGEALGDGGVEVSSFVIDSREARPASMFVAVQGERDGHTFVGDAFDRGAAAALVARGSGSQGFTGVVVHDTIEALAALASVARDRLGDIPVIAITGSTGKTSAKDLTAAALQARYDVAASRASFNNELGVPLTLIEAPATSGAVVAEIGARGPGQIAALARVVRHSLAVVTTIGAAHTELFGTVDEVARAKAELLETLPPDGTAVVGTGHDFVDFLVARAPGPVLTVGAAPGADGRISGLEVGGDLRPAFALDTPWGRTDLRLEMRGAHQAHNAALAVAAAVLAGASLEEASSGVSTARGSSWRMEVDRTPLGVTVVNDSYNANPASMEAALRSLAALEVTGRRFAVLGEMAELGGLAPDEHRHAGRLAGELGIDVVVAVGPRAEGIAAGAREAGCTVEEVDDGDAAASLIVAEMRDGDAVLVKASRVAGLERVAEAVVGHDGGPPPRAALTDTDAGARTP